jgi:hypothetical protein
MRYGRNPLQSAKARERNFFDVNHTHGLQRLAIGGLPSPDFYFGLPHGVLSQPGVKWPAQKPDLSENRTEARQQRMLTSTDRIENPHVPGGALR